MNPEDGAAIRQLWIDLGRPDYAYPTPAQLVEFIRRAPDHIAEIVAARLIDSQETADLCLQRHHQERQ